LEKKGGKEGWREEEKRKGIEMNQPEVDQGKGE